MRTLFRLLLVCLSACPLVSLSSPLKAGELRNFDDAALRAVQFVDAHEGWAVGDDGVIWHTIDGGGDWVRQPSGVRASLRSVHFVSPQVGWVAGREELPGGGSGGVVLYTNNNGAKWRRLMVNSLPGLNLVRFVDAKTGYLAGDGSEQFPAGLFATTDGGRSWGPVPGPRSPSWRAGDFDREGGALAGAWNRLAAVRRATVHAVEMDALGGRNLCGLQLRGDSGVAVGQGGLVLLSAKSRLTAWHYADLGLSREALSCWDFHAVHGAGTHVWVVGRPGSAALHSPDAGKTWQVERTGQTMPLNGVFFHDEKNGWAVGEMGTILATRDGGKTWQAQRPWAEKQAAATTKAQGPAPDGKPAQHARAAVLCVHARPGGVALDTAALLGGQDGWQAALVCLTAAEPNTADPRRVGEAARLVEAFRQAGGAAAETLWQFPLPSHLAGADRDRLLAGWNALHDGRAPQELLQQIVLALRIYRPEVVLCDAPAGGQAVDALAAEAVAEAVRRAADPNAFPEQLATLGLSAHQAKKLYAPGPAGTASQVHHDLTVLSPTLGSTVRKFSAPPAAMLRCDVPRERDYKLLAGGAEGADTHRALMQGVSLTPGGPGRRVVPAAAELSDKEKKAVRDRANLWALAEAPPTALTSPERLLANIGPTLADMPDDAGARVALGLAELYARRGQWSLARETYALLVDRYPAHPLAVQGCRWLMMHQASGEARHRYELGQFLVVEEVRCNDGGGPQGVTLKKEDVRKGRQVGFEENSTTREAHFGGPANVRRWYQGCLVLEKKLAVLGPLYAQDPAVQFCVQSARRQMGEAAEALKWYRQFAASAPEGAWRSCAQAELWLASRTGAAPKPLLLCGPAEARPYLDGKLDDACWADARPVRLQNGAGETLSRYPTEVRMAYDNEFLYLGVRCGHPEGEGTAAAAVRTRDVGRKGVDRVSLLLDVDRDYATCYHLQVGADGCVVDDCWGDRTWDPRWFAAIHREATVWTAEVAIPRNALVGDHLTPGNAWAANVVRVLPGRGVQALSLPAEAAETAVRGEGLGLLMFTGKAQPAEARRPEGAR